MLNLRLILWNNKFIMFVLNNARCKKWMYKFFLQSFYNVFDLFLVCTETMWMYLETKY